jgi:hypothetical protein
MLDTFQKKFITELRRENRGKYYGIVREKSITGAAY